MLGDLQLEELTPYDLEDLIKRANKILIKKIYRIKILPQTTNELRMQSF